ncbi:MAG: ribosome-binding factor A [Planctomycetota bacterium]
MRRNSKRREDILAALCSESHEDDGVPPRRRSSRKRSGRDRKLDQLCRQVARSLVYVLAGECHDEDLKLLQVVDVVPAPDAGRLSVRLAVPIGCAPEDIVRIRRRLDAAAGLLRTEVAREIHRKKAPVLLFELAVEGRES